MWKKHNLFFSSNRAISKSWKKQFRVWFVKFSPFEFVYLKFGEIWTFHPRRGYAPALIVWSTIVSYASIPFFKLSITIMKIRRGAFQKYFCRFNETHISYCIVPCCNAMCNVYCHGHGVDSGRRTVARRPTVVWDPTSAGTLTISRSEQDERTQEQVQERRPQRRGDEEAARGGGHPAAQTAAGAATAQAQERRRQSRARLVAGWRRPRRPGRPGRRRLRRQDHARNGAGAVQRQPQGAARGHAEVPQAAESRAQPAHRRGHRHRHPAPLRRVPQERFQLHAAGEFALYTRGDYISTCVYVFTVRLLLYSSRRRGPWQTSPPARRSRLDSW